MVPIAELWLPILVAAGMVTIVAALLWTLVPVPGRTVARTDTLLRDLGLMLVYAIVVNVFVAYVTGRAVGPGADYKEVFRFAATTAVLAYAGGQFLAAIRATQSWVAAGWNFVYGIIFGLLSGGPFGWLWPGT